MATKRACEKQATTTMPAGSIKRGDIVILTATELFVALHPRLDTVAGTVTFVLQYLPTGKMIWCKCGRNDPIKILLGGNSGGTQTY